MKIHTYRVKAVFSDDSESRPSKLHVQDHISPEALFNVADLHLGAKLRAHFLGGGTEADAGKVPYVKSLGIERIERDEVEEPIRSLLNKAEAGDKKAVEELEALFDADDGTDAGEDEGPDDDGLEPQDEGAAPEQKPGEPA